MQFSRQPVTFPAYQRSTLRGLAVLLALIGVWVSWQVWFEPQHVVVSEPLMVSDTPLYRLDINTVDSAALEGLPGIGSKLAQRIIQLRTQRGRFNSLDELGAIPGLGPYLAQVLPYLLVESATVHLPESIAPNLSKPDLNQADSAALAMFLPSWQAGRIVKFRRGGSGFLNWEEVQLIRGMDTGSINRLKAHFTLIPPPKLDLNTATQADLERLPKIGPYFAKKIIEYRTALGWFVAVEQLQEIERLSVETYRVIAPRCQVSRPVNPTLISINNLSIKALSRHPYLKPVAFELGHYRRTVGRISDSLTFLKACEKPINLLIFHYISLTD